MSRPPSTVAVIGTGTMGAPMAANIAKAASTCGSGIALAPAPMRSDLP